MTIDGSTTTPTAARPGPTTEGDGRDLVLDVRDLRIDLDLGGRHVPVIQDVSFQVGPGQIVGVVGESGSGKSMTALSVMGMLPNAATVVGGSIGYKGRNLLELPPNEMTGLRGREIGMVFQDPLAFLNPLMTVGQQVREALVLHGMSRAAAKRRAVELLELVGVRDPDKRVHDYPHQFSGGMRQRVIIAIAVANNPQLLIADEPTTALDVTVQAGILRLLARLRDELDTAILLITHDTAVVEEFCDTVMVMYAGRVVEHGTVADVLTNPRHPYTRELMRSSLRLDLPPRERLAAIPGQPPDLMHRPNGCPFHPRCPLVMERCRTEDPPLEHRSDNHPHTAACWVLANPLPESNVQLSETIRRPEPPSTSDVILEVDDVEISYGHARRWWRRDAAPPTVEGVSLRAYRGRALGLVGESGSGKSTVARAIVGLLPLRAGTIRIAGQEWAGADRAARLELRRTVQMVFQDPYLSLNPRQTIRQLISEPLVVHRIVDKPAVAPRVDELLGLVGLSHSLLDRMPYQLSGGQRQRVGIARALAMEPELIIADEPVSALDVSVQAQIVNLLADLRDELGLGYVVIAHDLSVVRHLCEEVAVMQDGKIVEHGSAADIFTAPQHPFTRALLEASPGGANLAARGEGPAAP